MKTLFAFLLALSAPAFAGETGIHCANSGIAELSLLPYDRGYHFALSLDSMYVKLPGVTEAPKGLYQIKVDFDDRLLGCTLNVENPLVANCQRNDFVIVTKPDGASARIPAVIEIALKETTVVDGVQTRSSRSLDVRVSSPNFEVDNRVVPFGRKDSMPGELGGFCEVQR